jgi:hypothetical protein
MGIPSKTDGAMPAVRHLSGASGFSPYMASPIAETVGIRDSAIQYVVHLPLGWGVEKV